MLVAERAEPFEEARLRRHDPHVRGDRLDDDDGDSRPRSREDRPDGVQVVERRVIVSLAAPSVTPGEPGMPNVATPEPAPFASNASE